MPTSSLFKKTLIVFCLLLLHQSPLLSASRSPLHLESWLKEIHHAINQGRLSGVPLLDTVTSVCVACQGKQLNQASKDTLHEVLRQTHNTFQKLDDQDLFEMSGHLRFLNEITPELIQKPPVWKPLIERAAVFATDRVSSELREKIASGSIRSRLTDKASEHKAVLARLEGILQEAPDTLRGMKPETKHTKIKPAVVFTMNAIDQQGAEAAWQQAKAEVNKARTLIRKATETNKNFGRELAQAKLRLSRARANRNKAHTILEGIVAKHPKRFDPLMDIPKSGRLFSESALRPFVQELETAQRQLFFAEMDVRTWAFKVDFSAKVIDDARLQLRQAQLQAEAVAWLASQRLQMYEARFQAAGLMDTHRVKFLAELERKKL